MEVVFFYCSVAVVYETAQELFIFLLFVFAKVLQQLIVFDGGFFGYFKTYFIRHFQIFSFYQVNVFVYYFCQLIGSSCIFDFFVNITFLFVRDSGLPASYAGHIFIRDKLKVAIFIVDNTCCFGQFFDRFSIIIRVYFIKRQLSDQCNKF